MSKTYEEMEGGYNALLSTMKIKPSWKPRADKNATKILKNKDIYQSIVDSFPNSNMPWYFVGIIHLLEGNCNFKTHLHNGDSLEHRTIHVPAGRPVEGTPPFSFEESAVDALSMKGYQNIDDWSDEHVCYLWEKYNGFGYANRGVVSPYLWSGSNHYSYGKYTSDGIYDPKAVSAQVGALPVLFAVREQEEKMGLVSLGKHSRRISFIKNMKMFLPGLGLTSYFSIDNLTAIKTFASDHTAVILLTVAAAGWVVFKYLDFLSTRELQEKRYQPSGQKASGENNVI